jgi:hypothetical protein
MEVARGLEAIAEESIVDEREEDHRSIVAALDDMLRHSGRGVPGETGQAYLDWASG